jgi:hypothetical protein
MAVNVATEVSRVSTSSLLEIVELADGEIVLQRAEGDSEPLVTIRFSEESRLYIMDNALEIARAMIQSGIQAAAQLSEQEEADVTSQEETPGRVLH